MAVKGSKSTALRSANRRVPVPAEALAMEGPGAEEAPSMAAYPGLANQGTTCCLNSLLQCLFFTPQFRHAILSCEDLEESSLVTQLRKVFVALQTAQGPVTTSAITRCLGLRNVHQQQDVLEFFQTLLTRMAAERAELGQLFQMTTEHVIRCEECGEETRQEEERLFLMVPATQVDGGPLCSVAESVQALFREEQVTGDNQYYCEHSHKGLLRAGDEYDGQQRVQMSCGHAVDPGNLTAWCRSLMDQGHFKLYCPAVVDEDKCGAEWPYSEVRRCAVLSDTEQREFEQKLALMAAKLYCDYKECPRCKSLVERKDLTTIRVFCIICTNYEFCWQCLRAWKGAGKPSDRCDNVGCRDPSLDTLASCVTKDLPGSEIQGCPSIRACPTCGMLIEHKEKCKYIVCSRCHVEFCFACLDLAQVCQAAKSGAWFKWCAKPLAPRQRHIPVWSRHILPDTSDIC
ncbi:PREDICTED: uncharacterized protein LOC102855121 [Elephantulus edwardii]|uniref:uncharacterized protein LOC102855121 n=1 Tax=Elephantulus edwardii TaxID=28737 RepID=UPI0003F08432|nr:PREDICTED: uncharacterized protein LOC102855121 [Elephantulus edwardii]